MRRPPQWRLPAAAKSLYPALALVAFIEADLPGANNKHVATRIGISQATVCRWHKDATLLTLHVADRYACALGVHPSAIWPDFNRETSCA